MIPTPYRLKLRSEQEFFAQAQRFSTRLFVIYHRRPTNVPQVAVIIPKRKIAKTVHRNKLKRQLYSLLYQMKDQLPTKEIVVYYKAPFMASYQELAADLAQNLGKIKT
ncbi:MAG TPA: ribonuclease P protein component [Patescibacteria group bacterium]